MAQYGTKMSSDSSFLRSRCSNRALVVTMSRMQRCRNMKACRGEEHRMCGSHVTVMWIALLLSTMTSCTLLLVQGVPIHPSEVAALSDIQETWGRTFSGWDNTSDCREAYGLRCDEEGHIIYLQLNKMNLAGNIPTSLGTLTKLQYLSLYSNQLTDSLPASLGNLSDVKRLDVSFNKLTGSIPLSFGGLISVEYLDVGSNQLTGSIPSSFEALGQITRLNLYRNQLSGSLPSFLTSLENLRNLYVFSNLFTGSIPDFLGAFTGLTALELSYNQLTGNIPLTVGNATNLQTLDLRVNKLTGGIPISFSALSRLRRLRMNGNHLTGSIPKFLGSLTALTRLSLQKNQLTGNIPVSLGALVNLQYLAMHTNQLTGSIPESLGFLTGLTTLQLYRNQLNGNIPDQFSAFTSLQIMDLSYNQLTGSILSVLGGLINLQYLDLSYNRLSGSIPASFGALQSLSFLSVQSNALDGSILPLFGDLTMLQTLNVGVNKLSGNIPASFTSLTGLRNFVVHGNKLTGTIPEFLGKLQSLTQLFLSRNQFTGSIPTTLCDLTSVFLLALEENQLTGSIPECIGAMESLTKLGLYTNQLVGSIPASIGALTGLQYLGLHENQLTGSIPEWIGALESLTSLALYTNQLVGSIPDSIGALAALQFLGLQENRLTGSIPEWIGALESLTALALYTNQLVGSIPASIGALAALRYLGVFDNQLTGSIPESTGSLTSLTRLVLRNNLLTGTIPDVMGALTNLQFMNLRSNRLTGSIPGWIGDLQALTLLNLAANQLTGTITSQLGRLTNLSELDLSGNFLGGACPGTLGNIQTLTLLDLAGSYSTIRCPDAGSLCGVDPKPEGFQRSLFCTQNCPAFCASCVPGIPTATESRGFEGNLKYINGRRNDFFRYASLLGSKGAPPSVDWRHSGHVFSVKDQANCSASWAFSAVAAVESAIAITHGRQAVSLSEQQLLDCSSIPGNNCGGGLPEVALDYIANTTLANSYSGLLPADYYAYRASTAACTVESQAFIPTRTGVTMYEEVDFMGWFGTMVAVQKQPVIANVHGSHPSFMHYDGTELIYDDETCAGGVVDHSIVIVGYNITSDPPYWIIRNSAGPSWGQGGFMNMRITKGNGICNIHSSPAMYPVITLVDPCESPLQPCGAGLCLRDTNDPPRPGRNQCLCPLGFVNVTNIDLSTSCAPVDPCNFYTNNPCGVGTCVNDKLGRYLCICPFGYTSGSKASDYAPTCVPALPATSGSLRYVIRGRGVPCAAVASAYGLSLTQLRQSNRQLTMVHCLSLPVNTALNVTASRLHPNCSVRFSWSNGDTCSSVAAFTLLPVGHLMALNPWLNCSAKQLPSPGQQVCLNVSTNGEPNGTLPRCTAYVTVNSSDTCASIISSFHLTPERFFALNPGILCGIIGAQPNGSASLLPIFEVCIDGDQKGVEACQGYKKYKVTTRDTCIWIASQFFEGDLGRMKMANGGWLCNDNDLYIGKVVCTPCSGLGCR